MKRAINPAREPRAVSDYFDARVGTRRPAAVVVETFRPEARWQPAAGIPVSAAWARTARRDGITAVAVATAGRIADFTITELNQENK